ncbi:hypothetical protein CSKR_101339 [Clonorchis sinensis]|uniref:Uncharacterized protein n=1 Tax=Clonorchis sinensis TaxID=79923 RepID=A0A3R7DAW1_CLOSI|nr:hypothetical protein CSKR_101339 [Clonorchis sinensis]
MVKFQPTVQQVGMNVSWSQLGSIGEFVVFAVNGTSGREGTVERRNGIVAVFEQPRNGRHILRSVSCGKSGTRTSDLVKQQSCRHPAGKIELKSKITAGLMARVIKSVSGDDDVEGLAKRVNGNRNLRNMVYSETVATH